MFAGAAPPILLQFDFILTEGGREYDEQTNALDVIYHPCDHAAAVAYRLFGKAAGGIDSDRGFLRFCAEHIRNAEHVIFLLRVPIQIGHLFQCDN